MKVLVACEYSGRVRDAFLARGHDAMSCDLLPTQSPGPHYQGDVMNIIGGVGSYDCPSAMHMALQFRTALEGAVVLSGYPGTLYDELYKDWRQVERNVMADGARKRREVLWISKNIRQGNLL